MKVKCINCDHLYQCSNMMINCPKCGSSGGYMQIPTQKEYNGNSYKLENKLAHKETSNVYQIKEFQKNGIMVKLISSALFSRPNLKSMPRRYYISQQDLNQYVNWMS